MVCGIGMVSLFAGVILWGVIDSFVTPDVTIEKPVIKNMIETAEGKVYEIVFLVKNNEKKSVKAEFEIKLGFDVYRKRHSASPKRSIYRVFQSFKESTETAILTPKGEKEVQSTVEVGRDIYEKFEITPETKIYPRVTTETTSWKTGGEQT